MIISPIWVPLVVDPGDHFKIEGGAFVKARAELPVMENVNLITTADFFTPYSKILET